MPIDITYRDDGGVVLKGRGVLSGDDVSKANKVLYETPDKIRALAYQLCDYSETEGLEMTSEWVARLAAEDKRAAGLNPSMLIAVVGKTELAYGLLRMWQVYAEPPALKTAVFRSVREAMDWIRDGLAMTQARPLPGS